MKFLHNIVEKVKPQFEKGGNLEKFNRSFEAFETFLFTPGYVTQIGSHIRDAMDMKRTMMFVVIALIPTLLFGMWNVGYQHFLAIGESVGFWGEFWYGFLRVLPIVIVSYAVGLGVEFVFASIRDHEVNEGFLVSGMLIPLVLPVTTPLWMVAVATIFAVIIGKEVFGGTGMNILNPALLARAFLFFAYPANLSGEVWIAGTAEQLDGVSGATPLAIMNTGDIDTLPSVMDMFLGLIPGSIGETSTVAILIGAFILIFTGVGSWRIMLSVVVGAVGMGLLFNLLAVNDFMAMPVHYHLIMGGFAFGTVYMATDPVTASQTHTGKYIYGLLIGVLTVLIRVFNPAFPEGMMLAILFMNVFAPLIDHYVVGANIKRRMRRIGSAPIEVQT